MPEEILKALLITSVAGSGLALAIAIIRPLTKKVLGYAWHYYIWLAVLLVMMLPVRFSIPSSEPMQIPGITTEQIQTVPITEVVTEETDNAKVDVLAATQPSPVKQSAKLMAGIIENRINILGMIWLLGMLVVLSIGAIGYIKLLHKIHKHSVIISCPKVQNYTKRRIKVRTCENLSSPFIMGIIRPTLVLPSIELTPEQLDNILKHETTHLKRNDVLYKWIVGIVKTIHWFNPLVYYISRQIDAECEISCDMAVVKNMSEEQEMGYVETILSLLAVNKTKSIPLTTGMTGNKNMLKRRFTMIRNKRTTKKLVSLLSVLLSVIMLGTTVFASGVLSASLTDAEDSKIKILYNNNIIELTNEPFIDNGTIYVPFRELFEKTKLSDYIKWDNGKIEFCLIEYDNVPIYDENGNLDKNDIQGFQYFYGIEIGKKEYTLNPEGTLPENRKQLSRKKSMDNAPILKGSITYIPYEYIEDFVNQNMINKNTIKVEYMSTKIAWPIIDGTISRDFGTTINPVTEIGIYHDGLDITAPEGTTILSSIKGKVIDVGFHNRLGNYIFIADNDISVMYGHLAEVYVSKDSYVEQNSIVGTVGKTGMATGACLHFEIRINGDCLNPIMFCNPTERLSVVGGSVFNVDNNNIKPIEIVEDNTKPHSVVDSFFRRFETKDYSGMKTFCKNSLWDMHYKEGQGFGGFELARLNELLEPEYINDNYILYEVKILSRKTTDTDYYNEINTWKLYVEKQPDGTYLIDAIDK